VGQVEPFLDERRHGIAGGRDVEQRGLEGQVGDEVPRERHGTPRRRDLGRHHADPVRDGGAGGRPLERQQRHLVPPGQHPQLVPGAHAVAAVGRERVPGDDEQDAHEGQV
jgi:hypothetical protein